MMRIVVSGGGSGGHIFPALAVAEGIRHLRPDAEVLFIGGATGMECQIVPERGVPFRAVTAKKLRKVISPSTIGVVFSLWKGYREAKGILRDFQADAVVGTGGYVAAAAVLAGARSGLPTVIVSPDVIPGRTNRLLARYARRICIAFEATRAAYPNGNADQNAVKQVVLTGLPLRAGVVAPESMTKAAARNAFAGLDDATFTVLIVGGSQGARALNQVIIDAATALLDAGVQVLHQTGAKNLDAVQNRARERGLSARPGYVPIAFLNEVQVPLALRAADVIVCRGGISTLSEAMVNGLPAIIVPLPTAYADHQTVNAKALEAEGAAIHQPESDLSAATLTTLLRQLREDNTKRDAMRAALLRIARPDAAVRVAAETLQLIEG